MLVAVVTILSWLLLHRDEPKALLRDRTTFLLIALMIWISITTLVDTGRADSIVSVWIESEKMLLMTVVAYILTNTRQRFDQLVVVCTFFGGVLWGLKVAFFALLTGGNHRVYGPAASKIGDNNDLGVAFDNDGSAAVLSSAAVHPAERDLKWPMRGLIGFTIIGALFTYSRGALCGDGCDDVDVVAENAS